MTVYNELMAETARRLERPDYFTAVDQVPAHMARSVLNRFNLLKGVLPGSELSIRDVPSALDSVGVEGIVPGELLFGRFTGHDDMKAVPWIAHPVMPDEQPNIDENEVRNELFRKIPLDTRMIMKHTDLVRLFALNVRNQGPVVMVDALLPLNSKEKKTRRNALARSAKELSMARFLLIESRQNITLLNGG